MYMNSAAVAEENATSFSQNRVSLKPIEPGRRVASLDILRGFGLLGILLLNIYDFASPSRLFDVPSGLPRPAFVGWHAPLDHAILWLTWLLAEGKMRSIFSMLFGAGVVLLTDRITKDDRAAHVASIFYRRNLWLLVIGLCHGYLIWSGDILVDYSLLAMLVLYFLRRLKARTLLIAGFAVWVGFGTVGFLHGFEVSKTLRADAALRAAKAAGPLATTAQKTIIADAAKEEKSALPTMKEDIQSNHRSYWEGRKARLHGESGFLLVKLNGLYLSYLGSMIVGMGLYKTGFLTNRRSASEYVATMIVGYAISFPFVAMGLWHLQRSGFTAAAQARWLWEPYCVQVAAGTLGDLSLLLLLIRIKVFQPIFAPVAAVGRTAISNYVLTSLLCKWIFSWGPWKLYGQLEYYQWYCVVIAIWCLNLLFSSLWLRAFAFGPLEWLWRSLTYWKMQPFRARSA